MIVKATREGLLGVTTSSGWKIDQFIPFVALPSARALRRTVKLTNPMNGKTCYAIVLDVGPWNEYDDAYVFHGARPSSESGIDSSGRKTNKAGIDLGEAVWTMLGMTDNSDVDWEFI